MRIRQALRQRPRAALVAALLAGLLSVPSRRGDAQGTLSALETDVDRIARAAQPSVVTVYAQRTVAQRSRRGTPPRQRLHTQIGSGVAVEENWIVTTASVVEGAERLFISSTNGLQADAEVVGSDAIFNLAVLRVRGIRLPPLPFSTRSRPQEGDWVMTIGTSPYRAEITHSVGTIAYRLHEPRLSLLQLTNTVYPGYSGGAVLNARGQLIGIVQGELGTPKPGEPGYESYLGAAAASFVLPTETVRPVYESLRSEGRVRHGYLGVSTRAASVESDTEHGLMVPIGALVEGVEPNAPAARAGLARGDLIVAFDRVRVEYPEQLARWVAATRPGTVVELVWVREDIQQTARVALTQSAELMPQWAKLPGAAESDSQSTTRITDLERQIQQLNRELERLKGEGSVPRR